MKKIIVTILSLSVVLSLAGCGSESTSSTTPMSQTQVTSETVLQSSAEDTSAPTEVSSGEFQPSQNLVKVQPYKETVKGSDDKEKTCYGLADGEGKHLCEPVYDGCVELPNGYALRKDKKYAFVSADGSVYSGLIYDMHYQYYDYSPDHHYARFITKTDTGVTVADYDNKTGQPEKTFDLKISDSGWAERDHLEDLYDGPDEYEEEYFILEADRYPILSATGISAVWDGTTGQRVVSEDGIKTFGCVGELLTYRPSIQEGVESVTVYDYSGHILYKTDTLDARIHSFKQDELYLIESGNRFLVMDATGKITAEMGREESDSISCSSGYLILFRNEDQIVYDSSLKELARMNLGEDAGYNTRSLSKVAPCFAYLNEDGKAIVFNLETGARKEFSDVNDICEDSVTGNINVYAKSGRQILNSKDLSVIA